MPLAAETILQLITTALPDAQVEIHDLAGDGDHYKAVVTCPCFAGKSRVAQHQMIYAALGDAMKSHLHALSIETRTPN